MSKSFRIFLSITSVVVLLIVVYMFVANPKKIVGNDVGKYKNKNVALFMSPKVYEIFSPLSRGNVVSFKRSDMQLEGVALVVGLPGDKLDQKIYKINNEIIGDKVPEGYCAVKFGNNQYLRAIPLVDLTGVAWYSL